MVIGVLAGGRCLPVAFCHTVRVGLVVAKPCLQEVSRHWADIAEGAVAAGGDDWVECGRKSRARWSYAFLATDLPMMLAWVALGLRMGPGLLHIALV
jgi:hypothetical protein